MSKAETSLERSSLKSQIKSKPKIAIELKPILKTRQLKLRKPTIREPIVLSNPVRPRPPRRLVGRSYRQLIPALLQHPRG